MLVYQRVPIFLPTPPWLFCDNLASRLELEADRVSFNTSLKAFSRCADPKAADQMSAPQIEKPGVCKLTSRYI